MKCVMWDLDGTLLDTTEGVSKALKHTLSHAHLAPSHQQLLDIVHAPEILGALEKVLSLSPEKAEEVVHEFRRYYRENTIYEAKLYPAVTDVLESINQAEYRQAIVTLKRQDLADAVCEHFGLSRWIKIVIGSGEGKRVNKHDLLSDCLKRLQCDATAAYYVGDQETDRFAAQQAGVKFIGVSYGYGFRNVLEYANSPREILNCIAIQKIKPITQSCTVYSNEPQVW